MSTRKPFLPEPINTEVSALGADARVDSSRTANLMAQLLTTMKIIQVHQSIITDVELTEKDIED